MYIYTYINLYKTNTYISMHYCVAVGLSASDFVNLPLQYGRSYFGS
jgi:hypothetical protein